MPIRLGSAKGGQAKAARHVGSAPEQLIAARRLDSFVLKIRPSSRLGCWSLGAAEFGR
ncbi:MAG: hypothetical protein WKF74_10845 [Pyrinomonadaceae bacterium]